MSGQDIVQKAFERHGKVFQKSWDTILGDVTEAVKVIRDAFQGGNKVLTCGNGGSAADAQHLAAEFVCKYKKEGDALPAIALTANTSSLTAVGNDYSFDAVFSRQIKAFGAEGDALIAFTTSGSSKNIIEALRAAKDSGLKTVLFSGSGGESLRDQVDVAIIIPSEETARIQEMHQLAYHALCEVVDEER